MQLEGAPRAFGGLSGRAGVLGGGRLLAVFFGCNVRVTAHDDGAVGVVHQVVGHGPQHRATNLRDRSNFVIIMQILIPIYYMCLCMIKFILLLFYDNNVICVHGISFKRMYTI